jgi:hypothetical protein
MDKRFGERQVFSLWRIMCGFNVADYVRFGCGGLCAVVISTYRKLLAGALKIDNLDVMT